jgi:hypothetical protein
MRDAIPIPVVCFAKHDKYGAEGMKLQYQYRAARLPRMLASTLSDLQSVGQANSRSQLDIKQQFEHFIIEFNTSIAPIGGEHGVSVHATPDTIV